MGGFALQYWCAAVDYPINVGGRPLNSWPSFIPVTFELTVLGGALAAVIGLFVLNGLPMPYHPTFNIDNFREHAQKDKFYLVIEAADPKFKAVESKQFLAGLGSTNVWEVPE